MNDLKRKFGHERYIIDDRNFIVKIWDWLLSFFQ
jgi:hypothetical protein